ncbi:MAG TPA: YceH family protein [Rhodocyclaceae bacterium]|nr:YceH family protein [Rhodocyclaceae bacterium]HRQ47760.1 YceH family protein [Rhodocyclaceae bacterium]
MNDNAPTTDSDEGFDLDPVELRVLGVLVEKAFVTPDAYPLSINAIVTGCNQLTAREPVMALDQDRVQEAVDSLMRRKLVSRRDSASARVAKYEHLVRLRHSLPPDAQAVLAVLILRGPQTPGEIRQRSDRMHAFADIAAVEAVLEHLADKFPPMVTPLPRMPGTKEIRYAHLLGGNDAFEQYCASVATVAVGTTPPARGRTAELEDEVRRLREEVDWLRSEFERFRAQFD